jgi:hypothetical protein
VPVAVLLEKLEPPEMVRYELDIDIAPPLRVAVLLEKVEPPEMVRIEPDIEIAPPFPAVAVLVEKLAPPEMVRIELDIDIAPPVPAVLVENVATPSMRSSALASRKIAPPLVAEFLLKVRFEAVKDTVEAKA